MFLDRHYLCERMHGEKSVTKYRDIEVLVDAHIISLADLTSIAREISHQIMGAVQRSCAKLFLWFSRHTDHFVHFTAWTGPAYDAPFTHLPAYASLNILKFFAAFLAS